MKIGRLFYFNDSCCHIFHYFCEMATTGLELKRIFDLRVDKAYTGYLDTAKLNRTFQQGMVSAVEKQYKVLSSQGEYDTLRGVIKVNRVFTPVANVIYTDESNTLAPNIVDYYHLLTVKAQYNEPLYGVSFSAATGTPIRVKLSGVNNIRTGDTLIISGATGNTNVNGKRYIKMVNKTTGDLYADANFQTPIASNGTYVTNTAVIARYWYEYCQRYFSDRKIAKYSTPTADNPKFEQDINNSTRMIFQPLNLVCNEITMDYITQLPVSIDVADNVIDLERYYDKNLLYLCVAETSLLFAQQLRDESLYATSGNQIQTA